MKKTILKVTCDRCHRIAEVEYPPPRLHTTVNAIAVETPPSPPCPPDKWAVVTDVDGIQKDLCPECADDLDAFWNNTLSIDRRNLAIAEAKRKIEEGSPDVCYQDGEKQ